jgi:hypothetical protein
MSWNVLWPLHRLRHPSLTPSEHLRTMYSPGQPKPAYFAAVGIPIRDMTETTPEARKCWEAFIYSVLKRLAQADHPKTQYLPF